MKLTAHHGLKEYDTIAERATASALDLAEDAEAATNI